MKFHIESTNWGDEEETLIEKYPMLKEFGYKDEHITVESLEALMELVNKAGCDIILSSEHEIYDPKLKKWIGTGVPAIEIYDGYRE